MRRARLAPTVAFLLVAATTAVPVAAQPLGTFRWQLQPHCNVLTLAVTQVARRHGERERCALRRVFVHLAREAQHLAPGGAAQLARRERGGPGARRPRTARATAPGRPLTPGRRVIQEQRASGFERAVEGAGLEGIVFHMLRHECLSRLAQDRKFDVLRLAKVGGHRDLRNVKRYAKISAADLANE